MLKHATLAAALAFALGAPAMAQDASTVVATVNGTDITLGNVIALRERLPEQYQQLDDKTLFDGLVQQLVQQAALASEADALTRRDELVLENERRALIAGNVVEKQSANAVSDDAVKAAFDKEYGDAKPTKEYNASHILVDSEEKAKEIIEKLKGGADFAELSKTESSDSSGASGGELGWFGPGAMVPEFDTAVQELEVGAISEPVKTQFGWHVIKLNEVRDVPPPTLDDVREQIEGELQMEAIEKILTDATDKAEVTKPETPLDPALVRASNLID